MIEIMTAKDLCLWYGDNKALKDINIAIPDTKNGTNKQTIAPEVFP